MPARWPRLVVLACVAALLIGDVAAFRVVSNRARPVALSKVVARFRAKAAASVSVADGDAPLTAAAQPVVAPAAAAPQALAARATDVPKVVAPALKALAAPTAGVYVYATSGHEDTDALGGVHHDYPDRTTITITSTACGVDMRWDALEQRWDQWSLCMAGQQVLTTAEVMKHAFYGVDDQRTYSCTGATLRPTPAIGTPVTGRCMGSGDTSLWSGHVVGPETITVAGQAVPALHVSMEERVSGDTTGLRRSDNWFALDSALLLKRTATVDGTSGSPVGRVHYTETVTMLLTSLTPNQ
jgi:hypothetical protein